VLELLPEAFSNLSTSEALIEDERQAFWTIPDDIDQLVGEDISVSVAAGCWFHPEASIRVEEKVSAAQECFAKKL